MIEIRPATPEDAGRIAEIYAPHVVGSLVSFELEAPDATEMAQRLTQGRRDYPWLVAANAGGAVVAYAYASRFRERAAYHRTVETTVYVDSTVHRQGIARHLYTALLDELRARGFAQAVGVIALPNPPSVALHEAIGFVRTGLFPAVGQKYGQWVDVGYWQKAIQPD